VPCYVAELRQLPLYYLVKPAALPIRGVAGLGRFACALLSFQQEYGWIYKQMSEYILHSLLYRLHLVRGRCVRSNPSRDCKLVSPCSSDHIAQSPAHFAEKLFPFRKRWELTFALSAQLTLLSVSFTDGLVALQSERRSRGRSQLTAYEERI